MDIEKLKEFLQNVLEAIDRPVFVVVDGLDECDTISRNYLLRFLKFLPQNISGLKTIKTALSFRPQEEILEQLDGAITIELASDTQRDRIIVEKMVELKFSYLSTNVKLLVIEDLSHLAQGSAIWAKMIIELIEVRKIRAIDPMQRFLEEAPLPKGLSQLYATLLSCCASDDPENLKLSSTALKLLAVAYRPLSICELAWAVALGMAQNVTTVEALGRLVDHQRVMSLIHPFMARVDFNDVKKHQVRLSHQSMKEFIIKEWTPDQLCPQSPALSRTDHMISGQRFEDLEALILDIKISSLG